MALCLPLQKEVPLDHLLGKIAQHVKATELW